MDINSALLSISGRTVGVEIVVDENGVLYAKLPDGKLEKIIAEVYGSPVYGFLRIDNLTEASDEMP